MIIDISEEENTSWQERGRRLFSGKCEFMMGVNDFDQLPPGDSPEVAFIGRSNVGKSSLINAITGRKGLARSSVTPGRTQQLNFFNLSNKLRLVDLPGYGFANVPKNLVKAWHLLIFSYLRCRPNLQRVFILIDARRGLKENDMEIMKMMDGTAVPYHLILTKADKVSKVEMDRVMATVTANVEKHPACYPYVLLTSSTRGDGIAELKGDIAYISSHY